MENSEKKNGRQSFAFGALILALLSGAVSYFFYFLLRGWRAGRQGDGADWSYVQPPEGLSEEEAAARYDPETAEDNVISTQAAYSRMKIARETLFTIFNLNLVILALIQFIFIRPLDGLITLGIIIANVAANIFQYELARQRMKEIQKEARPQITVMRGGKAQSIDPQQIVFEDVITAGIGDQIAADGILVGDGELLVDESLLGSEQKPIRKKTGDQVLAGSICVDGRAAYRAEVLGRDRQIIKTLEALPEKEVQLTPIEKALKGFMWFLLVVMLTMAALALIHILNVSGMGRSAELFDPLILILNLVPAGLFFMVVLTYVSGTADLVKAGGLVHQSRSVESLAQLDILCMAKAGFISGIGFELHAQEQEEQEISVPRIRQILGDFCHTLSSSNPTLRALSGAYPGQRRDIVDQAPFFSAYGWSGIVFDDEELQGLYVLADVQLLPMIEDGSPDETAEGDDEAKEGAVKSITSLVSNPIGRLFGRGKSKDTNPQDEKAEEGMPVQDVPGAGNAQELEAAVESEEPQDGSKGRFGLRRFGSMISGRVSSLVRRDKDGQDDSSAEKEETKDDPQNTLIFAYNPDGAAADLSDLGGGMPQNLTILGRITFEEKVKPESREALQMLSRRGVGIKIFTSDPPEQTAARLRSAGITLSDDPDLTAVDGAQLARLNSAAFIQAVQNSTVFGSLSPQQGAAIVTELRKQGHAVGAAGNGVNDVAALRAAELAVVRKDSSPAVLGLGDIVLLDEDQGAISRVMDKGQRIVNGLIDVLKLYLTQIFSLIFLIIAIPLFSSGFPYLSQSAGLITLITLTIPAIGLSLFATPGKLPRTSIGRILLNFVAPAGAAIAVLGFLVYVFTLQRTAEIEAAQNVLVFALIAIGLLLVLNIKPPFYISRRRGVGFSNLPTTLFVIFALVVFVVILRIPFFSDMYAVSALDDPQDMTLIIGAALVWLLVVRLFWRLFPVASRVGEGAIDMAGKAVEMGPVPDSVKKAPAAGA